MTKRHTLLVRWAWIFAVMFILPYAVAKLASECSGMALCMILFFMVNPLFSAILGYRCGKDYRDMWYLPLVSPLLFLAGTWLFFDIREPWFAVYAGVYLAIGYGAMAVRRYLEYIQARNRR